MWTLAAVGALADISTEAELIYRSANVAAAVFPACLEPELQALGRARGAAVRFMFVTEAAAALVKGANQDKSAAGARAPTGRQRLDMCMLLG